MSVGFGRSFQHVGLNRLGAYLSESRDKGPLPVGSGSEQVAGKPNEIWRRITGIYPGVPLKPKLRKRGLKLLARRLEDRMERARENAAVSQEIRLSFANDFKIGHEAWTRVQTSSMSIEAVCVELGCTRERLTLLLKEHCGLTAGEFFDALNFSAVRRLLAARMRAAAHELWGYPGSFMAVKLMDGGICKAAKAQRIRSIFGLGWKRCSTSHAATSAHAESGNFARNCARTSTWKVGP